MRDSSSTTTAEPTPVFEGYIASVESDLCEVEVNGCPNSIYFGEHFSTPCH